MDKQKRRLKIPVSGNQLVLICALIAITIIFSALNPNYFTYGNLINILVSSTLIGLTSIGITYLIMVGGNDLSAGAVAAFAGVFVAWMLKETGINWIAACVIAILVAGIAGLLNALMVTKLKIVPFIATLVSQSVWRGFAYLLCEGKPISVSNQAFLNFGKARIGGTNGIPITVIIMFVCFIIFGYILSHTKFGRSIFAIGGNAEAARLAGINADRVKTICYIMTSMFAAFAGIILASRMNSGQPAANPNLHFDAITAANLGGVSMVGGVGSIPSVVLGVLLVQAFNSGLNMVNVSSYWQYVARGMLLFASLAIDFYRQNQRRKRLLADSMKNL